MRDSESDQTLSPVVIVGGGPAGLAAAAELAFHHVSSIVVESRATVSFDRPRAKTTSVRTMEFFRRWGVAQKIRDASLIPAEWSETVMFCSSLTGVPVTKFMDSFGLGAATRDVSPERGQQVPQPVVEQTLRDFLADSPWVTFHYGHTVVGLLETSEGVLATLRTNTGELIEIQGRYLLGCDGSAGVVRKAIGARYVGSSDERPNFNIIFRAPSLDPAMADAVQYWVLGGPTPGIIGRLDLAGTWWAIALGVNERIGERRTSEIIADLVGREVEHQVLSTDTWTARMLIADRWQSEGGRIFLVGESAHLNPPWGGHGYNTCVGDAVNIGWKIAAVENGWGGDDLLATYELERRPVAQETIAVAESNMSSLPVDLRDEELGSPGISGDAARLRTGEKIQASKEQEFHSLGLVLGYTYADSPIVGATAQTAPIDPKHYFPSTSPGARLPHAELPNGSCLFDQLGTGFALIASDSADTSGIAELTATARRLSIPFTVVRAPAGYPWSDRLILVRPDQHVAWQGTSGLDIDLELYTGHKAQAGIAQR